MKTAIWAFIALLLLSTVSCKTETDSEKPDAIDGVYQSLGYGQIVKIDNGAYKLADVTSISCMPILEGEVSDFGEALQYQNDTLSLKDGINRYYFTRIDDAPTICKKDSDAYKEAEAKKNDPEYNFEVLWETFKDHYAYFELRKVNPDSMYANYRPRVTSETTDAELFFIMFEMLQSFNDGHIGISAPDEIESAGYALYDKAHAKKEADTSKKPKQRLRNYQISKRVADTYIPEGTSIKNGNLRWGILKNNVGYVQLNQMMAVADYKLSDTLSYRDYWMAFLEMAEESEDANQDELDGINTSLDKIMEDLANTDALIIDVRFNGGGKDEVGMAVLERLNNTEKVVFTKKGKMGNSFTPVNTVTQTASKNWYQKPVYLLIGPESASATEIMALSALSIPTITTIGSRTEGVFSDILDRSLPNGWEFGLSSEVYLDNDGTNYEGIGIPPAIEIGYSRDTQEFLQKVLDDLENNGDEAIEKALELSTK